MIPVRKKYYPILKELDKKYDQLAMHDIFDHFAFPENIIHDIFTRLSAIKARLTNHLSLVEIAKLIKDGNSWGSKISGFKQEALEELSNYSEFELEMWSK